MWCGSAVVAWRGSELAVAGILRAVSGWQVGGRALHATWQRDGGLAVVGPYASCRDGGALHAMLRRQRGLACRGGGLAVAGSCARRDGGAVVAGSCKPRRGSMLGWGRAEVACVHEGAATACNGSEAHPQPHPSILRRLWGWSACVVLVFLTRHVTPTPRETLPPPPQHSSQDTTTADLPHHGTQDPDRQPATFLQHGTQDPADSPRRLNTALKAPQPPTSTSPQHGTQDTPPRVQGSPDLPQPLPRRAAVAHDCNHDGHEHVAGNELGFCPSHVTAVAPNLRHTQVHHHYPAARKPCPNAMRSRHARPATTGHVTPTRPHHRQPTSTPTWHAAYATPPRQGAPDDADSPPHHPLNTVRKTTTAPTPP
ncbi:hypothetical protein EDB84DRAFT_1434716 [Lactarius hengduanensis]|nr:hypothetical protein EDB84DRAFT_1434716 [Lactarius hengduanensis]